MTMLHQYLQVELVETNKNDKTDLVKILEGPNLNSICSVPYNDFCESRIIKNIELFNTTITFSGKIVKIEDKKYQTVPLNLTQGDIYKIGFPIKQKMILPENYSKESLGGSMFANSWFPIINSSGKTVSFLHLGKISKGCLTIKITDNTDVWTGIYRKLLRSRFDTNYLCTMNVSYL